MSVLPLAVARADLGTSTVDDSKLQGVIDSAEAVIAKRCGPLTSVATTSRADGCGYALVLPISPVISLTSVVANTTEVVSVSDLSVTPSGVVEYTLARYYFPARWYTVAYQTGRATCPDDLLIAVRKLVRHLWQDQRGPVRRAGLQSEGASNTLIGAGYLLPFAVQELIAPYLLPGFA